MNHGKHMTWMVGISVVGSGHGHGLSDDAAGSRDGQARHDHARRS